MSVHTGRPKGPGRCMAPRYRAPLALVMVIQCIGSVNVEGLGLSRAREGILGPPPPGLECRYTLAVLDPADRQLPWFCCMCIRGILCLMTEPLAAAAAILSSSPCKIALSVVRVLLPLIYSHSTGQPHPGFSTAPL